MEGSREALLFCLIPAQCWLFLHMWCYKHQHLPVAESNLEVTNKMYSYQFPASSMWSCTPRPLICISLACCGVLAAFLYFYVLTKSMPSSKFLQAINLFVKLGCCNFKLWVWFFLFFLMKLHHLHENTLSIFTSSLCSFLTNTVTSSDNICFENWCF